MSVLKAKGLRFKPLEIDGRASISTDLSDAQAFGIYAYEFTDGLWYVGKSIDVRKRHVQHMHDYRHEQPPRVPKQMLWAEVHGDGRSSTTRNPRPYHGSSNTATSSRTS